MIYRSMGIISNSIQQGLDIAFVEFQEQGGKWSFEILNADCYQYDSAWKERLKNAIDLSALDYQVLHADYGHYTGLQVNQFIEENQLQYKVAVIASHGHSALHLPHQKMTPQLGDGGAIAALTGLPVITDFFSIDAALGGNEKKWDLLQQKLTDEAMISKTVLCAFMGILRWREEYNVFATESGASRDSIGGALWIGQDA